jgi:hypothetical protein
LNHGRHGRTRKKTHSENPPFDLCLGVTSEIHEQPQFHSGRFQIVQELGFVFRRELFDSLHFDDNLPKTQKVCLIDLAQEGY